MPTDVLPAEYDRMSRAEQYMWWYAGMRAIVRTLMPQSAQLKILDAGCGTGGNLSFLADYGQVTGIDLSDHALELCARPASVLGRASVTRLPFPDGAFDLVTSFDVLYMLPQGEDQLACAEAARILKPGGRMVIRVAAYNWLRGQHDRAWSTAHRYTDREVARLLGNAGLTICKLSYANMWLFPLALVKRLSDGALHRNTGSDTHFKAGLVNDLLTRVLSSEARLITRGRLPFGLSIVAAAQKPL